MDDDIKAPLIIKKSNQEEEKVTKTLTKKFSEDKEDEDEEELQNLLEKQIDKKIISENYLISKIYFLFFIQLSITFLFIYYAFNNQLYNNLLKTNKQIFWSAITVTALIFFGSYKWKEVLSTFPFNYFFFLIFTLSISFIACKIVILFQFKTIAVLWVLLLIMVLSLATYAYNSKTKIKIVEAVIFDSLILISFSLIIKFASGIPFVDILLILLVLISLAVYFIYDVRSLINDFKIRDNDFIFVNIFLFIDILRLFGKLIKLISNNIAKYDKNGNNGKGENTIFKELNNLNEDIEKCFNGAKNIGKKDESEDGDDEDDDSDSDSNSDSDNKKGKGKDKKGKKDDKGKGKKNDKGKKDKDKGKGKSDKKKEKGKKEDKKKGKKEDKKEKNKKEDKKENKKKGNKKNDNKKKLKNDDDEFFNDDNINKIGNNLGGFIANSCENQ